MDILVPIIMNVMHVQLHVTMMYLKIFLTDSIHISPALKSHFGRIVFEFNTCSIVTQSSRFVAIIQTIVTGKPKSAIVKARLEWRE